MAYIKKDVTEQELQAMDANTIKRDVIDGQLSIIGFKDSVQYRNGKAVSLEHSGTSIFRNGQAIESGASKTGVVGKLDAQPTGTLTPEAQKEAFERLQSDVARLKSTYPQLITAGEDGKTNVVKIKEWIESRNAMFTFANFVACINDVFRDLVFDPARIGLNRYGHRMTGDVALRSMPAADFDVLLKPSV
jgi:hypothetical protein